jgi:hypothetical protein
MGGHAKSTISVSIVQGVLSWTCKPCVQYKTRGLIYGFSGPARALYYPLPRERDMSCWLVMRRDFLAKKAVYSGPDELGDMEDTAMWYANANQRLSHYPCDVSSLLIATPRYPSLASVGIYYCIYGNFLDNQEIGPFLFSGSRVAQNWGIHAIFHD